MVVWGCRSHGVARRWAQAVRAWMGAVMCVAVAADRLSLGWHPQYGVVFAAAPLLMSTTVSAAEATCWQGYCRLMFSSAQSFLCRKKLLLAKLCKQAPVPLAQHVLRQWL